MALYAAPPMDLALYAIIVVLFALWATVHVLLCAQLARRDWKKGTMSFFVFPLAPFYGQSLQIKKLPAVWVTCGSLYFLALISGLV